MVILEDFFKDFLMRKRLKTYQKQAEKALKTYQKRYFRLCFKDINVKKSPAARLRRANNYFVLSSDPVVVAKSLKQLLDGGVRTR